MVGTIWAITGAALAIIGGGIGSSIGITYAARTASGVLSEDPEKFGRLLVLAVLPGTQGIYGFITAILVGVFFGLLGGTAPDISAAKGIAIFVATLPVAVTTLVSGIYQGLTAASGVLLVAKKPEEAGKAFVLPALVETYAIFALVATILFLSALR